MGDVWFGGKTRNPWKPDQGSSGSSAGSASATAAGAVGFAIGTETRGSIVSPCNRCGATGLRPTFGRVSRYGAMALSWSMDKLGPIARSVEDCALVFHAIYGPDDKDLSVIDLPFNWNPGLQLKDIRIGYLKESFERDKRNKEFNQNSLDVLRSLGVELIPVKLPEFPVRTLNFILSTEASAAFDELTRSNRDDLLVSQSSVSWPNTVRQARFVPAVEYIQANRARVLLMQKMAETMKDIDVIVAPTGVPTGLTNLTGHPAIAVKCGFVNGPPRALMVTGRLYEDATICRIALAYDQATEWKDRHPTVG